MFAWLEQTVYGSVTWLNIIAAVLIFISALIISKLVAIQLRRTFKDKISREHLSMLIKVVSYGIMIVAILWILPTIGLEPSGLMVAGGIVALAIGFASQSIIGNLISGLFLMGERPVKIGDIVEISGSFGIVDDINIISTLIRTMDGFYVRIPNETVFTSSITNYSINLARRFEYKVGIRYSDDADLALKVIREVIADHTLTLVNPPPQVFVDDLADSSVDIIIRVWAPAAIWYDVYMDLLWKMKTAVEAVGIEIPFPQRVLWRGSETEKVEPVQY